MFFKPCEDAWQVNAHVFDTNRSDISIIWRSLMEERPAISFLLVHCHVERFRLAGARAFQLLGVVDWRRFLNLRAFKTYDILRFNGTKLC